MGGIVGKETWIEFFEGASRVRIAHLGIRHPDTVVRIEEAKRAFAKAKCGFDEFEHVFR